MFRVTDKFSSELVKSAFKLEGVKTDNTVFRLHYKLSVWLTVLYSIMYMYVCVKFPISCVFSSKDAVGSEPEVMNDYCWVHGVFSLNSSNREAGRNYPGQESLPEPSSEPRYQRYYLWMYFLNLMMIIFLYTPRQLWLSIENGRMKVLSEMRVELQFPNCRLAVFPVEELKKRRDDLAEYLISHLGSHGKYAWGFIFCEFLNVVVVMSLMILVDMVTGYEFSTHGIASMGHLNLPAIERTDPLAAVFPIVGRCIFKRHGPSGNPVPYDGICVLPLNLINERAVVFFWYYFMVLLTIGLTALIFRLVLVCSKSARVNMLRSLTPLSSSDNVKFITDACSYSDWFMVTQLSSCLDAVLFRQVIDRFGEELRRT